MTDDNTKNKSKLDKILSSLDHFKRAIVTIISKTDSPFVSEIDEIVTTTGFIIDMEKLLILTSKKAARMSPSTVKVQFYDGKIANANIIYSDLRLPYGIIQVNKFELKTQNLANYFELKLGSTQNNNLLNSQVLIIGITPKGEYNIKTGNIINTNLNLSSRYGSIFQTSFHDVIHLKGCPVWNQDGEVIGMHIIGKDKVSYELKIDYVLPVLEALKENKEVKIGEIGIDIDLINLNIAVKNYRLNEKNVFDLTNEGLINKNGSPKVMVVSNIIQGSSSFGHLVPGDIILKVNEVVISNDLLMLDQILNKNVQKEIEIEVSRNGENIKLKIHVQNLENFRINEYLIFNGAYFHNTNPYTKWYLSNDHNGIYLSYLSQGSPFSNLSTTNKNNKCNYILTRINSQEINSIDSMIEFLKGNCDNNSFYIEGFDLNLFAGKLTSSVIDLNSSDKFIYLLNYNHTKKRWMRKIIDLSQNCFNNKIKKIPVVPKKPIPIQKPKLNNSTKIKDINKTITKKPKSKDKDKPKTKPVKISPKPLTKTVKKPLPVKHNNTVQVSKPKPPKEKSITPILSKNTNINNDQVITDSEKMLNDEENLANDIIGDENSLGQPIENKKTDDDLNSDFVDTEDGDKAKRKNLILQNNKLNKEMNKSQFYNNNSSSLNSEVENRMVSFRFKEKKFEGQVSDLGKGNIRKKKLFDHLSILHNLM